MTGVSEAPRWVITGQLSETPGKVLVIASLEVTGATMTARQRAVEHLLVEEYFMPSRKVAVEIDLQLTMDGVVIIEADSYEAAFASLFEHWSPDRDAATRSLPAGGGS